MTTSKLTLRDLFLGMRMCGWSLVAPVLKYALPLPTVVRIMAPRRQRQAARHDTARIVQLAWWTSRVQVRRFPDNCLERSLVAYRFLGLVGADPRLVVGVRSTDEPARGHVWVTLEGKPVHDSHESPGSLAPILEFGSNGAIAWRSGARQSNE